MLKYRTEWNGHLYEYTRRTTRGPAVLLQGNSNNINFFLSIVLAQKLIIGLIIRHVVLSLNIVKKHISKPKMNCLYSVICRIVFWVVAFVPVIFLPKQTTLILATFFCHA
jgi:hypothetical protein